MNKQRRFYSGFFTTFAMFLLCVQAGVSQEKQVDSDHAEKMAAGLKLFKSEVKQVLVGRCIKCHGGDDVEGELDLSSRKSLMAGGQTGPAIIVGKAKSSLLYKMITHEVEPTMPEDGAKLDQRNIDAIAQWIDLGAPYDRALSGKPADPLAWTKQQIDPTRKSFWSFQPLKRANVPKINNDQWSKTDIDRFVREKQIKKGITPSKPIDRARLARRMYLAVIGLPPTPTQLEEFVGDRSPEAIDKLINSLLESKHFGEKWARHWLDVARFAESHGFEQDYNRPHAYHFRDFVIKAFNDDLPFDKFVKWQIAGDEIAPDKPLALMATGFLGAGVFPTQLTEKEFEPARYDELDDMAATVGTAMLGITIGCARCHDHKFDPIPQRDYYQFVSTFTTTIRSEVELELDPGSIEKELDKWQKSLDKLLVEQKRYEVDVLPEKFEERLKSPSSTKIPRPDWVVLDFQKMTSRGGANLTKQKDGSILATGKNPEFDTYEFVTTTRLKGISAIRIEALADKSLVRNGPGRASNGNFGLGELNIWVREKGRGKFKPVQLVRPRATFEQNRSNLAIASSIDKKPRTGWAVDPQFGKDHAAIFEFSKPLELEGDIQIKIAMNFDVNNKHSIGRPRISVTQNDQEKIAFGGTSQTQSTVEIVEMLLGSEGKLTEAQRKSLFELFRQSDEGWQKIEAKIRSHKSNEPKAKKTKVMISSEGVKPLKHHADGRKFPHFYRQTHYLKRGDTSQKQGVAPPGLLQIFEKQKSIADYKVQKSVSGKLSYRRTALANWMTDTENGPGQQLARVIVNRIWQHYFGRGIVATPNDFGFQGARPTHPELLDWLALRLIEEDWSLKAIHRLILQSAVYQQASEFNEENSRKDLNNELLWRYSPRRLEAELIRDSMLSVSGTLDKTMFGAGTLDERMTRRSIYFMIKRSQLIPMMQIFDSPEPLVSVARRPSTTIAPQALLLMNNPNVRHYANNFAKQIIASSKAESENDLFSQVVEQGFRRALGRKPNKDELDQNIAFIKQQILSYKNDKQTNELQTAVADFCQVLFCLNEFVYVD